MNLKIFILFLSGACVSLVSSQSCSEVLIIGQVEDTLQPQGFYNLMVINKTNQRGVFGNPNGSFSVYASIGDEIAFSVKGYPTKSVIVSPDLNCQMIVDVYISKKPQEFDEVIIYPIKSLQDIKAERARLSMRETRTVTGVNALQSPITALYERFSKKAQSRQLVAQMEFKDSQEKVLKELLRAYVSYDVVYLNEEHFESFIYFLNMDEQFLRTASDYELITYIKDKLEHYKALHPEFF
jgi:hypothetical protein